MDIYLTSVNKDDHQSAADLDDLISKIAVSQDTDAFAALYHSTSASVYGFALSILKNTQDAEDVLHDCYLTLYSAAVSYCPSGKPMAWILRITRNLCLLKLRERQKTADIPQEDWEPYLRSCEGVTPEDRVLLAHCMQLPSDEERQIVVLHAVAGYKHREISELLELPLPTVLSKYNRAIKKLKKTM